jgi:hypothetical protein
MLLIAGLAQRICSRLSFRYPVYELLDFFAEAGNAFIMSVLFL